MSKDDPYRYFNGASFKEDDRGNIMTGHCEKCGCATNSEEAWVNGQIWCHPCADKAAAAEDREPRTAAGSLD